MSTQLAILQTLRVTAKLFRMHHASTPSLHFAGVRQRARVVVLGLALCVWLIALATHIHSDGELSTSACNVCLLLPTGAPAPDGGPAAQRILVPADTVANVATASVGSFVSAFYLSRGPPAE